MTTQQEKNLQKTKPLSIKLGECDIDVEIATEFQEHINDVLLDAEKDFITAYGGREITLEQARISHSSNFVLHNIGAPMSPFYTALFIGKQDIGARINSAGEINDKSCKIVHEISLAQRDSPASEYWIVTIEEKTFSLEINVVDGEVSEDIRDTKEVVQFIHEARDYLCLEGYNHLESDPNINLFLLETIKALHSEFLEQKLAE